MTSILDASALISLLPTLLPSSDKKLKQPQDALAALSHSIFSALAFRLIAVDDSSSALHSTTNTLPTEWNQTGPGSYTFRYKHEQSSLEFIVKISKLGSRTLFNAIAVENDKATSLDISTEDFTSPSAFPYEIGTADAPLVHCFISSNRVADFVSQFKLKVIQKLVPGLRKDGYTEEAEEKSSESSSEALRSSRTVQPQRPQIPRYDPDEEFPFPRTRIGPHNPLSIGRRDLDPIPGGSFQPPPIFPPDSGDGMFVGLGHPIFGGRRGQEIPGVRGPWGGDGYLPPMGAPPGARFDPVSPVFPGIFGPRRGNIPGGGNLHGPDNDEFMPPGAGDMFM